MYREYRVKQMAVLSCYSMTGEMYQYLLEQLWRYKHEDVVEEFQHGSEQELASEGKA